VLEARHPVAARVLELAILVDAERTPGRVRAVEALEDAVGAQCAGVARADNVLGAGRARRGGESEGESDGESGGEEGWAAAHDDGSEGEG